jgi:hypothetical protein
MGMASWTYATEAAPGIRTLPRGRRESLVELCAERGNDVLLGVGLVAVAAVLLIFLPHAFNVDSWLALVTGREVWQSGLPHHETLTALAQGTPWVDQQWLSQLLTYGAYLAGGLGLLGVVNVALIVGAVAWCAIGARRLGAAPRSVLLVLPLCAVIVAFFSEVRTQEFVLPLFAATVYLLASDSRTPSRRAYWCLPLLVLWANLHGTAVLGAALVALRGLTLAWERRAELLSSAGAWVRPLVLLVAAPATLLLTPYGLSTISYYRGMLLGGPLRQMVTEWLPITSEPVMAVVLLVLAGGGLWAFGRYPGRTTLWERLALVALAAASIEVMRNALFFALLALLVLPLALPASGARRQPMELTARLRRARLNLGLAGLSLCAMLVLGATMLARPNSSVELVYQRTGILRAVEHQTAAHPQLRVFADVRVADWLLWRDPALRGRIANDARFELLSTPQITRVRNVVDALGANWKQGLEGFRLVVLDRRADPGAVSALLREPAHRTLYDDGQRIVILRAAGAGR